MIWLMVTKNNDRRCWFIKPESPCYKGEVGCCLFGLSFTLGWGLKDKEGGLDV